MKSYKKITNSKSNYMENCCKCDKYKEQAILLILDFLTLNINI